MSKRGRAVEPMEAASGGPNASVQRAERPINGINPAAYQQLLIALLNAARDVDDHSAFNMEPRGGCWLYGLLACIDKILHAVQQSDLVTLHQTKKVPQADRIREALLRSRIFDDFRDASFARESMSMS